MYYISSIKITCYMMQKKPYISIVYLQMLRINKLFIPSVVNPLNLIISVLILISHSYCKHFLEYDDQTCIKICILSVKDS